METKKVYKSRAGAKFATSDAQEIGELIDNLKDKDGFITARKVLANAQDKDSKLHKYFEWEDSKAASAYRLQQAREIVNHIVEVVVIEGKETIERSFVSVNIEDQGKVYVTINQAISNENYSKQLLGKMINTMENLTSTMRLFQNQI